jgi:GT2 family glycosyltransferase
VCFGNIPELYHGMRLADRDEAGPAGDLALLRCAWAVTGACVALRKSLYLDVGGLDERLAVAYNDIDLCRKIAAKGLAILCTPFAELLHFESISRGFALSPAEAERDATELMAFWSKHPALYERHDPFFNPQLDQGEGYVDFARPPRLSRFHAEFNYQVPKVQTY